MSTATPIATSSSKKPFPTPSFVSPEQVTTTSTAQMERTLSAGLKKRQKKRKLDSELQRAAVGETRIIGATTSALARKKHKLATSVSRSTSSPQQLQRNVQLAEATTAASHDKKPLHDISNNSSRTASSQHRHDVPTRKLDFAPTPESKAAKKPPPAPVRSSRVDDSLFKAAGASSAESGSSSSSSSDDDASDSSSDSGYSSDEAEVAFDAVTLGNTRIVREAESPLSNASTATASTSVAQRPGGLEYRFSVASTVSSIAVAPNGQFLVVGFYNGTVRTLLVLLSPSLFCGRC